MIDRIRGRILTKPPAAVVIEVGGIGFIVSLSISTWERLPALGSEATLFTHLHVREDALLLFGFDSVAERETFLILIGVNGVGPKLALAVLSRFDPDDLAETVATNDLGRLQSVPGVGKKTAERLMIELKDRLAVRGLRAVTVPMTGLPSSASQAVGALETLGFNLAQADEAVRKARKIAGDNATVEELVKLALKG